MMAKITRAERTDIWVAVGAHWRREVDGVILTVSPFAFAMHSGTWTWNAMWKDGDRTKTATAEYNFDNPTSAKRSASGWFARHKRNLREER